ncbi:MAG TPA: SCP2 sterol-binding domain-containing protein [Acidimicrobiales bacterium]|nr:SCP2 sterol-binding domain-containing protein [Acidimicrobiales bacterium]
MAEFLSDAWLTELADRASSVAGPSEVRLVIQQVVVDGDGPERAYGVVLDVGQVRIEPGRTVAPDVTFTQDRETAAAIARGDLSAQAAFLAGRLRIGGDVHLLAEQAAHLATVADIFAEVRAATTW